MRAPALNFITSNCAEVPRTVLSTLRTLIITIGRKIPPPRPLATKRIRIYVPPKTNIAVNVSFQTCRLKQKGKGEKPASSCPRWDPEPERHPGRPCRFAAGERRRDDDGARVVVFAEGSFLRRCTCAERPEKGLSVNDSGQLRRGRQQGLTVMATVAGAVYW